MTGVPRLRDATDELTGPGRQPRRPNSARFGGGRSAFIITVALSLGLHLAWVTAIVLLTGHRASTPPPGKPVEVELVMEEHQGAKQPPKASMQSAQTATAQPMEQPVDRSGPPKETEPASRSPPIPADAGFDLSGLIDEPMPHADEGRDPGTPHSIDKEPSHAGSAPDVADPAPEVASEAPTISLSGTDSPSDARAWGNRIIPAKPDAVFHNRPPEYPRESARNGETGTVILTIHVSPAGLVTGVEILRSSGFALLDRAASAAVANWRFLPAVQDGQPVASEMSMGFVFEY